jgi:hypothetical protein
MATESISERGPRPAGEYILPADRYLQLTAKLGHLESLLEMTYGGAAESFSEMSDRMRDQYMWACADLARDCSRLAESLAGAMMSPGVQHG